MWPAWPPSWWRGGTKNNYRPIYSPARKTWRVTSRFSPVSREAFQAPRGPSLPCHALCAVYLCGRWGHQESLDKLRKVNCGRSAQPPCSAPLANLRAMRVSRACIDADRYHQGPCSRGHWYFTQSNRVKTRDCSFFPFFFFFFRLSSRSLLRFLLFFSKLIRLMLFERNVNVSCCAVDTAIGSIRFYKNWLIGFFFILCYL